jgi:hypothetical protein
MSDTIWPMASPRGIKILFGSKTCISRFVTPYYQ